MAKEAFRVSLELCQRPSHANLPQNETSLLPCPQRQVLQVTHRESAPLGMSSHLKSISMEILIGGQRCFLFHSVVNNIHGILEIILKPLICRLQLFSSDWPDITFPISLLVNYPPLPKPRSWWWPSAELLFLPRWCSEPHSASISLDRATLVFVMWQWVTP